MPSVDKVILQWREAAEGNHRREIKAVEEKYPCLEGCDCSYDKRKNCPAYNMKVVVGMIADAAMGTPEAWDFLVQWASAGRWAWMKERGFRTYPDDEAEAFRKINQ